MSTTPHITQPSSLHHEDDHGHAGALFGMRAVCALLAIATFLLAYMVIQRNALLDQGRTQLSQANAETAQAKTDFNVAKTQSAGLQSQLDEAKRQRAAAAAELANLQSVQQSLRAQMKGLQDGRSSLQSQLADAKAQSAELQARLGLAEDKSSALSKQVESANSEAADLRARLVRVQEAAAKTAPAALASAVPVATSFDASFWGGYTLHVSNPSADALRVTITVAGSNATPVATTIPAGGAFELKHLDAGAQVTIGGAGYKSLHFVAR
jgi:septal ring factor EnvC (AmiA/AmiB activator)